MHYSEVTNYEEKELLSALFWLLVQYTSPDDVPENEGVDYRDAERTTYPYTALANAVYILHQYDMLTISSSSVGRAVTFKFNEGVLDWAYGRKHN